MKQNTPIEKIGFDEKFPTTDEITKLYMNQMQLGQKVNEIITYLFPEEGGISPKEMLESIKKNGNLLEPLAEWEERFNHEFRRIGWIPENKAHILDFIRAEKESSYQQGRDDMKAELRERMERNFTSNNSDYNKGVQDCINLLS